MFALFVTDVAQFLQIVFRIKQQGHDLMTNNLTQFTQIWAITAALGNCKMWAM